MVNKIVILYKTNTEEINFHSLLFFLFLLFHHMSYTNKINNSPPLVGDGEYIGFWSLVGCTRLILRNRTNAEAVVTAVAVLRANVTAIEVKAVTVARV